MLHGKAHGLLEDHAAAGIDLLGQNGQPVHPVFVDFGDARQRPLQDADMPAQKDLLTDVGATSVLISKCSMRLLQ